MLEVNKLGFFIRVQEVNILAFTSYVCARMCVFYTGILLFNS